MNIQRFADDFGDGPSRVQRAEGILKNYLEAAAAGAQFLAAQGGNVLALEHNPAGGRLDELDGGAPERGLATTALTHQPNRFARCDGEAHVIHGAHEFADELDKQIDPYGSIMVKAIADRFAEAFAEFLHHKARVEWGYETEDELTHDQLIHENYQGIRPAPGYPAQPDHTEKPPLFELLGASAETGVTLTESCAMHPGAAVCGLYFSHPESHYFAISELQKDQVDDYARRKGISLQEAEKWLGPWLGYA